VYDSIALNGIPAVLRSIVYEQTVVNEVHIRVERTAQVGVPAPSLHDWSHGFLANTNVGRRDDVYIRQQQRPSTSVLGLFISRPEMIAQQSLLSLGKHLADGCDYDVRLIKLNVFRALVGDYQIRVRGQLEPLGLS
jgi:hypothetical protein